MLSAEAVAEFRSIYLDNFGVQLSQKEAKYKAVEIYKFFKLIHNKNLESNKLQAGEVMTSGKNKKS